VFLALLNLWTDFASFKGIRRRSPSERVGGRASAIVGGGVEGEALPLLSEARLGGSRGNTGNAIRLARQVGGRFDDTASNGAAWAPVSLLPQEQGPPTPFPHFIDRAKPGVIVVDRRGRRFANEAVSYHDFVPKMIEACQEDQEIEAFVLAGRQCAEHHTEGN
jgi:hypothetical protein